MYYPDISDITQTTASLKLILRKLAEDPNYLEHPECPFPETFIQIFGEIRSSVGSTEPTVLADDTELDVEVEATALFKDMKDFKFDLKDGDISEKASMFRTLTSLMEKIISVRERASSLKNYEAFERIVFDTIDGYLSAQQRTELFDQIKELESR